MTLAPIVLFAFNRPLHTQQTVESLQQNVLARESELYVYSDAPKTNQDVLDVAKVRAYIKDIKGFKKILIVEREHHQGLANNIIDGVNIVVAKHKKVIVVEDDLVTSPCFLSFMNNALFFYENKKKVMHISGWNYPINPKGLPESFLWRAMNCWGWSTWDDRWQYYERNAKELVNRFDDKDIYRFNLDGTHNFWYQVLFNLDGRLNTWATFWYVSIFLKGGLCLNPTRSYVKNIGLDGSGEHSVKGGYPEQDLCNKDVRYFPDTLQENSRAVKRIKSYLKPPKRTILNRLSTKIKRFMNNPLTH